MLSTTSAGRLTLASRDISVFLSWLSQIVSDPMNWCSQFRYYLYLVKLNLEGLVQGLAEIGGQAEIVGNTSFFTTPVCGGTTIYGLAF